jgi:hypothetical protein
MLMREVEELSVLARVPSNQMALMDKREQNVEA